MIRIDQWMKSESTDGRGPNWLTVGVRIVRRVRIDQGPNCPRKRSELTKVRIVQGPNCPTFIKCHLPLLGHYLKK